MNNIPIKALFESGQSYDFEQNENFRIIEEKTNRFIVEYNNKIFNVSIESCDVQDKSYNITVNDVPTQLTLKNELDQLIDQLGLKNQKEENVQLVLAPMPGLVIDISVSIGDKVDKNDVLLVLEAMKMENVIKSKGQGIVKAIHVDKQDKVDKAQILIEFE